MDSANCFRRGCGAPRIGVGLLLCVLLLSGLASVPFHATAEAGAQGPAQATPVAPEPLATENPPSTERAPTAPVPDQPTPVIRRVVPTLTLTVAANAIVGEPVRATASLRDADRPTGRVTFTVFVGDICAGQTYVGRGVEVVAGTEPIASDAVTFEEVGPFSWLATYSGDATNEGVVSDCVARHVDSRDTLALTVTQGSDVSFGSLSASGGDPGTTTNPGSGDAQTYVKTDAVTVEVTGATGPWVVTCSIVGGDADMELAWQLADTSGNHWMPFSDAPCYTALDGGDRTLTFHYRLRIDKAAEPGHFAFEVTYAVSPLEDR